MMANIGREHILLSIFSLISSSICVDFVNLEGTWKLNNAKPGFLQDLNATVPGGIYTDLLANGIINNPYVGNGDVDTRWVGNDNWTYSSIFKVTQQFLENDRISIFFEGLDTIATISVNQKKLGQTNNMFLKYEFDVKDVLTDGDNLIEIFFQSSTDYATKASKNYIKKYKNNVPPNCTGPAQNGECHANFIRKMQASFSWDWGPAFPSVGIWKPVYLKGYKAVVFDSVSLVTKEEKDKWIINIDTVFSSSFDDKFILLLTLTTDTYVVVKRLEINNSVNVKSNQRSDSLEIVKSSVKLWWPNGYGKQNLYPLEVKLLDKDGKDIDSRTKLIGFRTVKLVQDPIGRNGLSFYFTVNSIPIFAKGSNAIPIEILPEQETKATVLHLLESAKEAHFNMLRVWGGGVYSSDYFYETADRLGIMIWQDLMFACALYPVHDEFLKNVRQEVRFQFRRLRSHPSIVLWAGNNENEAALVQNWYGNTDESEADYKTLYIATIEDEIRKLQKDVLFVSSSPSNGDITVKAGGVSGDPGSNYYGDVHYYNYLSNPFEVNHLPTPRFVSEYGYQGHPSLEAYLTATKNPDIDLQLNSDFLKHRQHLDQGNTILNNLLDYQFKVPKNFSSFVYYSQVIQAMAIKVESEFYRSKRSILNDANLGGTMGALYWQLNDVWVAPTWASIDYTGRWKMLHYYAAEFFAPVITTGYLNSERELEVYVVSDRMDAIHNVTFSVDVVQTNSFENVVAHKKIVIDIEPTSSKLVEKIAVDDILKPLQCGRLRPTCFIRLSLKWGNDTLIAPENFVFPAEIKHLNFTNALVKITSVDEIGKNKFKIVLDSDNVALFVWLDSHEIRGRFSENGFIMTNSSRTVFFAASQNNTLDEFKESLTVTHLLDVNHLN